MIRRACIAGALLALGPGAAGAAAQYPATASVTASDAPERWNAAGGGSSVAIALGGTVSFAVATGRPHDASFPADAGVACTAGDAPAATRIPATPSASWTGTCTFSRPGFVAFVCTVHGAMRGEVAVAGPDGSLPTHYPTVYAGTSQVSWGPPSGHTPVTGLPPGVTPQILQNSLGAIPTFTFARTQRGSVVRGTIARAKGATATVDISARRRDLSTARRTPTGTTRLRRLVRTADAAGDVHVAVRLPLLARRALSRRGRLTLMLRATVRGGSVPAGREAWTRKITLRAAA